jgi:predicted Zn finger-like uncharacterized protein
MAVQVACPKCAASLVVDDGQVGWRVRCPACMEVFVAGSGPAAGGSPLPVPSAAQPVEPAPVPSPATPSGPPMPAASTVGPVGALSPAEVDLRPRCGLATASLVLGILALCCFGWLAAVPSILCGALALRACKEQNLSGEGRAKLGLILAVVALLSSKFTFDSPFPSKLWKFGENAWHFNIGR